jgi:subtilisin-like proprotein convertase family protein
MKSDCFIKICSVFVFFCVSLLAQGQKKSNFWSKSSSINHERNKALTVPKKSLAYDLDIHELKQHLISVNSSLSKNNIGKNINIEFPNINGEMESFSVSEASVFEPELQLMYPNIRSYIGVNQNTTIRFSVSNQKGLSLTYTSGKHLGFIEKISEHQYSVYRRNNKRINIGKFECLTTDNIKELKTASLKSLSLKDVDDGVLRTYKFALSVTSEYTEYHFGNTVISGQESAAKGAALAAMNATVTRINGIFERDFGVRLSLISGVNNLIYTDPNTDPYSDYLNNSNWTTELQDNLTATIGNANYDIGHLFGHDGGGGNAGCIGCICTDNLKGSGYTSPANGVPEGDFFDIDYVSHELGHQFGANHTWTADDSGPNNENTGANLEPGSGSTIMGYAGISNSNVQAQGDDYFHFKSIEQITTVIKASNCAVETSLSQNTPTANAGNDYTIPHSTAFVLKGQGSSDGNTSYCWEQNDVGGFGVNSSDPSPTNISGPLFRSYPPSNSLDRYMPALNSVLNGNLSTAWETVSSVSRNMHFKLTVRDNILGGGQNITSDMTVSVDDTNGPFVVTSQNEAGTNWSQGTTETITWEVAGTNLSPINTSQVNILLSIDGGLTFSPIISNTPNDGSQDIIVPNLTGPFCRVMVAAVDNIYYAVNSHNFSIDYQVIESCEVFSDSPNMPITDNAISFDETTITIPGDINTTDVNISVEIEHSWLSDLLITVLSPDGTEVELIERACTSDENMEITFNDSGSILECANPTLGNFIPSSSLSKLIGESGNGDWTLRINDNGAEDIGTLVSWSIELCSAELTPLQSENYFNIYPNPSSGFINIALKSENQDDVKVSLIDMAGRLVLSKTYILDSPFFQDVFDYGTISQGIYMLKVELGNDSKVNQIIIK